MSEQESVKNPITLGLEDAVGKGGICLVPPPTANASDPLNWPQRRKLTILATLCIAAFAGTASSLANQLAFEEQGRLYHRSLVEMSYSISAAVAGLGFGPLLFVPPARVIGRCSTIWWSLLSAVACNVWAACMTHTNQYIPFVLSRLFAGIFGSVPSILGPSIITDVFFLHERGRSLAVFHLCFLLGTVAGPTFGGFIVENVDWPVEFWWTVALQGLTLVLVFLFLEETSFGRNGDHLYTSIFESTVRHRVSTFFLGNKVVPKIKRSELLHSAIAPFMIGLSPVTVLAGSFQLISFGWFVMINTLLTVFLQEPREAGGYGFNPEQNAEFTFSFWLGILFAQFYGHYINDWLPLRLSRRRGGSWRPEYRLHALWLPSLVLLPVGLGIFGAGLQYHTHFMVLALGVFLITFAAMLSVPVTVNYVIECFPQYALEASAIMGTYRLALGLAIPFFVDPWEEAVGVGWVFGMAAFFSVISFMLLALLMYRGDKIRKLHFKGFAETEEGSKLSGRSIEPGSSTQHVADRG